MTVTWLKALTQAWTSIRDHCTCKSFYSFFFFFFLFYDTLQSLFARFDVNSRFVWEHWTVVCICLFKHISLAVSGGTLLPFCHHVCVSYCGAVSSFSYLHIGMRRTRIDLAWLKNNLIIWLLSTMFSWHCKFGIVLNSEEYVNSTSMGVPFLLTLQ